MGMINSTGEVVSILSDDELKKFWLNPDVECTKFEYGQICYKKGYEDRDKEIIRCEDCKFYTSYYDIFKPYYDCPITEDEKHNGQCSYIGKRTGVFAEVNETDSCSHAERRKTDG